MELLTKKKKAIKKGTERISENYSKIPTELDVNFHKLSETNNVNDPQAKKNSLIEDFSLIKTKVFERSFTDFQLKMKSRGFQNTNELPVMLDIILGDVKNLENLGKELKLYWNNYFSSFTISKINYSKNLSINNEIRKIIQQNSQSESK